MASPAALCNRCRTDVVLTSTHDRSVPARPASRPAAARRARVRAIARRLYEAVRDLPIISPHGHVDPRAARRRRAVRRPGRAARDARPLRDAPAARRRGPPRRARRRAGDARRGGARAAWRRLCERWHLFRGTPVALWLEAELAEIFGVTARPSAETADAIYDAVAERLAEDAVPAPGPVRALRHRGARDDRRPVRRPGRPRRAGRTTRRWSGRVIPTFRPDRYLEPGAAGLAGGGAPGSARPRASTPATTPASCGALEERRALLRRARRRRRPTTATTTSRTDPLAARRGERGSTAPRWRATATGRGDRRLPPPHAAARWPGCPATTGWS